ncbi:MAG: DUF3185 family protein [Opitutaceae bacterium]|nr:DUF3185 family protein [Opitutaceae bacterium]
MNKAVSLVILLLGIALLVAGNHSQESLSAAPKISLGGASIDRGLSLTVLGVVGTIVGGLCTMFRRPEGPGH